MFSDEAGGSQIEDQSAIELFVEGEVKVVEGFLWVSELRLFLTPIAYRGRALKT